MTHLTDKQHDEQMADMKAFDEQMPCVEEEFSLPYFEFIYDEVLGSRPQLA